MIVRSSGLLKNSNLRARRTRHFLQNPSRKIFFYSYESKNLVAIKSVRWSPQVLVVFIWNHPVYSDLTNKRTIKINSTKNLCIYFASIIWQCQAMFLLPHSFHFFTHDPDNQFRHIYDDELNSGWKRISLL